MPKSVHVDLVNDKAYKLLKEIPGNAAFVRFNLRFGYSVYCLLPQLANFILIGNLFLFAFSLLFLHVTVLEDNVQRRTQRRERDANVEMMAENVPTIACVVTTIRQRNHAKIG